MALSNTEDFSKATDTLSVMTFSQDGKLYTFWQIWFQQLIYIGSLSVPYSFEFLVVLDL